MSDVYLVNKDSQFYRAVRRICAFLVRPKSSIEDVFTVRRNARIASAVLAIAIPSVCPSVRLLVRHTPALFQNDGT